jgi:outer membrane biosynthesis protein TonB
MSITLRGAFLSALITCLALFHPAATAAKACKGLSKSSCSSNTNCSWVKSYTTKTGAKVNAYCRTKSGKKSSSPSTASKPKKAKDSAKSVNKEKTKKDSAKSKQSNNTKKVTEKKKKESKKDKEKKKDKKEKKSSKS